MPNYLFWLFQQLDYLVWWELWQVNHPLTYKVPRVRFSKNKRTLRRRIKKYLNHNSTLAAISLHLQKHIEQQNIFITSPRLTSQRLDART